MGLFDFFKNKAKDTQKRDEDGFGITDDEEINLYGAIDRKGKVVKKFTFKR